MLNITDPIIQKELADEQFKNFVKKKKHLKNVLVLSLIFLVLTIWYSSFPLLIIFLITLGDLRRRNVNYRFEKVMMCSLVFDVEIEPNKIELINNFWY